MVYIISPLRFTGLGPSMAALEPPLCYNTWQRYIYSYTHALLGVSGFLTH